MHAILDAKRTEEASLVSECLWKYYHTSEIPDNVEQQTGFIAPVFIGTNPEELDSYQLNAHLIGYWVF